MLTTNQLYASQTIYSFIYKLITSLLLYGLVYEVLSPWYHSSAWGLIFIPQILLLCSVAILLWGVLFRSVIIQSIGYLTIVIAFLYYNFAEPGVSFFTWLTQLPLMYSESFQLLWQNGLYHIDDFLRITCLLIGWTILMFSFQQLIWQFYASISILIMVMTYLVTLHVLFGLNIYDELIKVVLYGSLLMALTFYMKRKHTFSMLDMVQSGVDSKQPNMIGQQKKRWYFASSLACLIVVLMLPIVLLSGSKEKSVELADWTKAITNRLLNNMTALSTQVSGQPLSRLSTFPSKLTSGYSEHDDELGASLNIEEQPVFQAWSAQAVYWRGEAKATYTGKGWSDDARYFTLHQPQAVDDVMLAWSSQHGLRGELLNQEIKWLEPVAQMPLFHGGIKATVTQIEAVKPDRELTNYIEDEWTSNLYAPTEQAIVSSYKVMTELPITDEAILEEIEPLESELAEYVWQHEGLEQYIQLPEQLPVRVAALANEIASGGLTSRYDQVKAIEQYLKENYTYSTKSEKPTDGQDFVDHFLFEQQSGYCVHFASAMVVLLRAQDIPARYVKGYTAGEAIDERISEDGYVETLYEVGQEDAHAWVEVYFPGAGWVPFDPTPSSHEATDVSAFWQSVQNSINKLNIADQLATLKSFLQTYGSYFAISLASLVAALLLVLTLKLFSRSSFVANLKYAKAYEHTMRLIGNSAALKHEQHLNRMAYKQKSVNRLRKQQQQHFNVLVRVLEQKLKNHLQKLERIKNSDNTKNVKNGSMTYRQRIEFLSPFCSQSTVDLLLSLCVWIETIHYSAYKIEEIVHLLPQPKQLAHFSRHIRVDLSLSE